MLAFKYVLDDSWIQSFPKKSLWVLMEYDLCKSLLCAPDNHYDYLPLRTRIPSHFSCIPKHTPLRCVLWLSSCRGRTGPPKLIINNASNNYLCLLSTITVPRDLHVWIHWVLTSTFWRRFCYDSQIQSWNIQWLNNLVMSHGWWWRNSIQTKVIQLRDPILAIVHSG